MRVSGRIRRYCPVRTPHHPGPGVGAGGAEAIEAFARHMFPADERRDRRVVSPCFALFRPPCWANAVADPLLQPPRSTDITQSPAGFLLALRPRVDVFCRLASPASARVALYCIRPPHGPCRPHVHVSPRLSTVPCLGPLHSNYSNCAYCVITVHSVAIASSALGARCRLRTETNGFRSAPCLWQPSQLRTVAQMLHSQPSVFLSIAVTLASTRTT